MTSKDLKGQSQESVTPESDSGQDATGSIRTSKRKLLKSIAATAPVVMAVSSKPALANFCTVSGFLSGNLSNPNSESYCGGRSPGYWINHVTPEMQTMTFRDVFGDVWEGNMGRWLSDPTLYEVLRMSGHEDRYQFAAHAVAVFQNALLFPSYPLSVGDVGDIVSQVLTLGVYTHAGTGRTLDAQEVVDFFYQTFDAG